MPAGPEPGGRPLLALTSFATLDAPPLQPPADLTFDLRVVPNPPPDLRAGRTGRDPRLQAALRADARFAALLAAAEVRIAEAMAARVAAGPRGPGAGGAGEAQELLGKQQQQEEEQQQQQAGRPTLAVGVLCGRGHHRSVAFVEELARKPWPRDWEVRVAHRDIRRPAWRNPNGARAKKRRAERQRAAAAEKAG